MTNQFSIASWCDCSHDIVWNTVGFQIPWDQMDAAMRDAPGDDREMPEAWYSGQIDVLDIVVERQQRVEGEWAPAVVLKTMPARWSLRDNLIEDGLSRKDRDAIVESLWLDRGQDRTPSPILQDILRPEFYATASDRWSAPLAPSAQEDDASKGDNWREIANWKRKLREAQKKPIDEPHPSKVWEGPLVKQKSLTATNGSQVRDQAQVASVAVIATVDLVEAVGEGNQVANVQLLVLV